MSSEEFCLSSLLNLKSNMCEDDFNKLKCFVDKYNNHKISNKSKSIKFIVCTPSEFYMEVHPSLSLIDFKDVKSSKVSEEYKDCYVYLVIINDSPLHKKLNESSYDEVLHIKVSQ